MLITFQLYFSLIDCKKKDRRHVSTSFHYRKMQTKLVSMAPGILHHLELESAHKLLIWNRSLRSSGREVEPLYQSPTQTPADPIVRSQSWHHSPFFSSIK